MLLGGDYVTAIKLDTRFAQTRDYFCFLHILLSVEADAKIDTRIRDTMDKQSSFRMGNWRRSMDIMTL